MIIHFATCNPTKLEEAIEVLSPLDIHPRILDCEIMEGLSTDLMKVIRDKTLQAYKLTHMPVYVEHGSLEIAALNGLPGSLSKVMLDALQGKICDLIPNGNSRKAIAKSAIGYCDGKNLHIFQGRIEGSIANRPLGDRKYYYDPIFIPDGGTKTFAQMTVTEKTKKSHVREAYEAFAIHLNQYRKG